MVLKLRFTADDLARTRFAFSPIWEVVASVRVLKSPDEHRWRRPWIDRVRPRLAGLDWGLLSDLIPVPTRVIPGFICPPPSVPLPDIDLELAALRATSPDQVRHDLPSIPGTPRLSALRNDPDAGLERLCEVVEEYWRRALAPYWPRIHALFEADVFHRARQMAEGGADRLLNDLDPTVRWDADTLFIEHRHVSGRRALGGQGMLLVPSAFVWPRVFSVSTPPWQPTLRYSPRGIATLWEARSREPPEALAAVIGRSRARILAELDDPASTQELADRTGLAAGGVSRHLTALRDAGLVTPHRAGRYVLYARTGAGEALIAAPV